jgi:hypothetical protein
MLAFYREKVKAAVEAKRPLTRSVVDEKIATTRQQLEDAVKRKAFVDCGPLQDKLDGLIALQSQLPTVDELKKSILDAEAAMSLAAQNRNFSGAAAAQKTLDDCRNKLAEALEGEEEVNSDGDEAIQDQIHMRIQFPGRAGVRHCCSFSKAREGSGLEEFCPGLKSSGKNRRKTIAKEIPPEVRTFTLVNDFTEPLHLIIIAPMKFDKA